MDFDFSDEQRLIQDQARQLLTRRVDFSRLRQAAELGAGFDRSLWREISGLGWLALGAPEAYGGLGCLAQQSCLVSEELGRSLAPVPFAATASAIDALSRFGSEAQKAAWLPRLVDGVCVGAVDLDADLSGPPPSHALSFEGGRLQGRLGPVPEGDIADVLVTHAVDRGGCWRVCVVDLAQPSVERRRVQTFDQLRGHAVFTFAGAAAEPLDDGDGDGDGALAELQERAAIRTAFEQVGGAGRCVEMATAYALERRTFGRLIGSYQAIKHRLADMFTETELARSNAYAGAWAIEQGAHVRAPVAAAAHLTATAAYKFAATENIQIHGGIGFTWEANCHFYFRRARLLAHAFGPSRPWVNRLVDAIDPTEAP
jgi:acyl-CoA dehydrogenase